MSPRAEEYAALCLERTLRARATTRNLCDIPFGPDPWQRLDLYLPPEGTPGGWPTLLFIHGGYWTHGHKEWMGFMAPAFTDAPAAFISVGYRLAPASRHPAQVEDCAAAVAWAYAHIAEQGGDPDRLFVGGHSAGGHLAMLLALQSRWLVRAGVPASSVRGLVSVSGVYDLTDLALPQDRVAALLGADGDSESASPLHSVQPLSAQVLLAIGEADFPVLKAQHRRMREALLAAKVPTIEVRLHDADHFDTSLAAGDATSQLAAHMRRLATAG